MEDDDSTDTLGEFFCRRTLSQLCTRRNVIRITLFAGIIGAMRYFGAIVAIIVGFLLIVLNLRYDPQEGGPSAYSVFNEGMRPLMGDLRAEAIDRELRGREATESEEDVEEEEEEENTLRGSAQLSGATYRSRLANRRCACGSGKKTKKCCGAGGGRYD